MDLHLHWKVQPVECQKQLRAATSPFHLMSAHTLRFVPFMRVLQESCSHGTTLDCIALLRRQLHLQNVHIDRHVCTHEHNTHNSSISAKQNNMKINNKNKSENHNFNAVCSVLALVASMPQPRPRHPPDREGLAEPAHEATTKADMSTSMHRSTC